MTGDTLYELLGVPTDATTDDIKSAYRRLSKTYHPDGGGTAPFFRQLQHAHETLIDVHLRTEYDRSLGISSTSPPPQQEENQSGYSDPQYSSKATSDRNSSQSAFVRFFQRWSRTIDKIADKHGTSNQSRLVIRAVAWVASGLVAYYLVTGFLRDGWFAVILLIIGIVLWRRYRAKKLRADAYRRAAYAEAARKQAAKDAANRQRAERAASAERERRQREQANRDRAASAERAKREREQANRDRAARYAEAERNRAEREAEAAEAQQDEARHAAESGDLAFILALSPTQFEYTMAALLRMLGMTDVERVGGRGDLGVDITARDPSGRTMVVQCKRYARTKKIGSPDIQKFIGMAHVHHKADIKLFVTTSEYTEDARALARHHDIQLMNGSDIENLARRQRESKT
jgi:curved DNA-binding protein CbpA